MMQLIDTHNHIDIDCFDIPFSELLQRARRAGVVGHILPGVERSGWARMLALAEAEDDIFAAPGLHTLYLARHCLEHSGQHSRQAGNDLDALEKIIQHPKVVAIGEIGLDYHVKEEELDRDVQQSLFTAQLKLAEKARLPILLHIRKAHDIVLKTLRRSSFAEGGIVHAYSGSLQQARQFIEMGFMISICGTITYDRAQKVRRIATELPAEHLVIETDAPDIPTANHRDQPNKPEFLPEILHCLAALRNEDAESLATITTRNARRCLRLPA